MPEVNDRPLVKPAHLADSDAHGHWLRKRVAAAVALAIGVIAFGMVAIVHGELSSTPDWHITVPGFLATAVAAAVSVARREPKAYGLWLLGLGFAGASLVMGWFLMVAIVIGATAVVILILHSVM